ncbi:MFS family permease [Kitasatospora sp. GP30]|uniref:MFS transporter n=1 Tax=Kitasatospora sp. GP30 TaxID=3035084 RepID=UPI000C707EC9|nr:MFS transporter [Kitasatospora sp. GP30]MDH6142156.1 MFS family permease [Kitasatospora sp. GP30]
MLTLFRHRAYRRLFAAQVIALLGTGLATVALSLLAYDLAGARAGSVLGTALAIKMIAFVALAPLISAQAHRLPRRVLLVGADLIRAAVALALPFVTQVWQVYLLIFVLQAASASFTPAFQSVIPELLPEERQYTRALSLASLAYDLESLVSPALAGALLTVVGYHQLFFGTTLGFLASATLVVSVALPSPARTVVPGGVLTRATHGMRLFWRAPRLRALLALNLAVACGGAVVFVNTVVYVRDQLHRSAADVPFALGAYGAGSMTAALLLPPVLERLRERTVLLGGGFAITALFLPLAAVTCGPPGAWKWPALLATWAALGAACAVVNAPAGRLIRAATTPEHRADAFAAQFSLSHSCWLLTYPLAGWLGATAGLPAALAALGAPALLAAVTAARLWPAGSRVRPPREAVAAPVG